MLISVQSTDPKEYNTVRVNFDIPWKCEYVKYYVSSINTFHNIFMTTKEDKFEYWTGTLIPKDEEDKEEEEDEYEYSKNRIVFGPSYTYETENIITILNKATKGDGNIEWSISNRRIKIKALKRIIIEEPTHRVKLILGLYNTEFPIDLDKDETYICQDIPILNHNKLYLVSLQGNPMYSNIGEQQHTPSIIGTIDTITKDKLPLIYNFEKEGKPLKIKTYTESLKNLEISLVDFQFQPIVLKSPLFLSVKIKPAKNADVKDILTK